MRFTHLRHFQQLRAPALRYPLGHLATPLQEWDPPLPHSQQRCSDIGVSFLLKRDDWTGGPDLGGNKVRKLEFLLAEALADEHDVVVTIGGSQSNHCRATAVAAARLGLSTHLILREDSSATSFTGNLLFDRLVGATIHTVSRKQYAAHGSEKLLLAVKEKLLAEGRKPYLIPVGGSNALGTWGYLLAMEELKQQLQEAQRSVDIVTFACGSGGTAYGIGLGNELLGMGLDIQPVGVCDSPEYFYEFMDKAIGAALLKRPIADLAAENLMRIHQGKGAGYAVSRPEELEYLKAVSLSTGIVLDPVYTGKALYTFMNHVRQFPEKFRNKTILFWHTGGQLSTYSAQPQLEGLGFQPPKPLLE